MELPRLIYRLNDDSICDADKPGPCVPMFGRAVASVQEAAEIVRRCNDYPALAARLERAMRLLARYIEADSGIADALTSEAAALLAEHEKETRP